MRSGPDLGVMVADDSGLAVCSSGNRASLAAAPFLVSLLNSAAALFPGSPTSPTATILSDNLYV